MSLFPIASDKAQLTTAAVAGGDNYVNGILTNSLNTLARAATAGGTVWQNGLLFTPTGQVVYVDATAGLPANTQYCNGLPLSSTGALCISTGATATYSNGLPFVANGALSAQITP
jgi:hypothetical protein